MVSFLALAAVGSARCEKPPRRTLRLHSSIISQSPFRDICFVAVLRIERHPAWSASRKLRALRGR
jgi:hypothetical protein